MRRATLVWTRSGRGSKPFVRQPALGVCRVNALRQTLPDFLLGCVENDCLTKFIVDRWGA